VKHYLAILVEENIVHKKWQCASAILSHVKVGLLGVLVLQHIVTVVGESCEVFMKYMMSCKDAGFLNLKENYVIQKCLIQKKDCRTS